MQASLQQINCCRPCGYWETTPRARKPAGLPSKLKVQSSQIAGGNDGESPPPPPSISIPGSMPGCGELQCMRLINVCRHVASIKVSSQTLMLWDVSIVSIIITQQMMKWTWRLQKNVGFDLYCLGGGGYPLWLWLVPCGT